MTGYTRHPRAILWLIPGGRATIGGPDDDAQPGFEVTLPSFYLAKFPITNVQYAAFDPDHRRHEVSPGDDDPAVGVSFEGAVGYCRWYAEIARKPIRLPTEVEWEYACRAGTTTRYFFGDEPAAADDYVWDAANSDGKLGRAQAKRPNPFGLLGMLGGVWEWTSSQALPYPPEEGDGRDDPDGASPRILRGGSFRESRGAVTSATRRRCDPRTVLDDVGFRILREFPTSG